MTAVALTQTEMKRRVSTRADAVEVISEATAMMEAITRAAIDPNVDVEKLERLMALHERMTSRRAEQVFSEAMKSCKALMPPIFKGSKTDKNTYADLEEVSRIADPVITDHGFVLSYGTADSPKQDHYRITCDVRHEAGHKEHYFADVPADTAGAKGNANKSATQGFGSTMSYGRRYLKCLIFDLITTDDNDGAGSLTITSAQVHELDSLVQSTGSNLEKFLKYMKVKALWEIPAGKYASAKVALLEKQNGAKP